MGLEQYRERVTARIVQSVRQSGVNLDIVSADEQQRLIQALVDGMLLEIDAMLDDVAPAVTEQGPLTPAPAAVPGVHEEQVLWQGRPFLSLTESYVLTTDRIRIFRGMLSKSAENIELVRLQDVDYRQHVGERMLNIGDVMLYSADASDPAAVLRNVSDPEKVQEIIRRAWLDERRRYGVVFREEM
jgi:hypothetical protein